MTMSNNHNSKHNTVAQRYVTALVQIAQEENQWDSIDSDLTSIIDLIDTNKDIEDFLMNPTIPVEDKKDIVEKTMKNVLSSNVYNLLNLLLEKNRIYTLQSINYLFKEKVAKKNNIVNVQAVTAISMDEGLKEKLVKKLEQKINKTVNLKTNIDESIIGGVIIKIDDKVIDGSIKAKLAGLKNKLI